MFWDKVSGIYDLFGKVYNGRVNSRMCRDVAKEISTSDRVLECACGTGLIKLLIRPALISSRISHMILTGHSLKEPGTGKYARN